MARHSAAMATPTKREPALTPEQFTKAQVAIRKLAVAESKSPHTHDSIIVTAMNAAFITIEAIGGVEAVRFIDQQMMCALDCLFLATYFEERAAEAGALTNAEIARSQAMLSRDQVLELTFANQAASAESGKLRTQLRKTREQLSELQETIENAVIPDPTREGKNTTLHYLVESGEFRLRCRNCQSVDCKVEGGCGAEVTA
jgi:hypothetical protein